MSTQSVNIDLFLRLIKELGIAKFSVVTQVSIRVLSDIKKGYVPSPLVQRRIRDGLNSIGNNYTIEQLFPSLIYEAA